MNGCFFRHVTITGSFELFQYFNFESNFLKNENFLQKTGTLLLVESTKNDNVTFPYKTSGVTGSKPGQVRLKDFWVHKLA